MDKAAKRNRYTFGLGTIGRDMVYTIVAAYLMFYLTDVIEVPTQSLWWITGIILACRVFDALNDPFMGLVVDNTHTRWGRFKPWIALGALLSGVITVLLFTDFQVGSTTFVVLFAVLYLLWGVSFTVNDIAYWSMLPSLSMDQNEREKIGSFARICANIGMFAVVAAIVPVTTTLGEQLGSLQRAYHWFALVLVLVMMAGQCITLFFVKEPRLLKEQRQHTPLRELASVIVKNDQLSIIAISMALFTIGYMTTTDFGLYFFKYAFGDEGMYSVFAIVLGVSQITALAVFPALGKRFERRTLYNAAMVLIAIGYAVFFFAPNNNMPMIGTAGVLLFVGQAFVQVLMLMFLADTVDYGQWKLGKRNDSISFSLQPFINKMGGAVASGIIGAVVILSGIKDAKTAADVTPEGIWMMKSAMMVFPLVCILVSYLLYRWKFKIDRAMHKRIVDDLARRGELNLE